jgi:hypothetical protein
MKTRRAVPSASILIESMRDIGYSLDTALADIIDNSITAKAKTVRILADTAGMDPTIGIVDDGDGMDEHELFKAMRMGSQNPLDKRSLDDLGRFGLGLKTASFSQCRRLTIITRKDGQTSCARWDLDQVAMEDDWLVELPSNTKDIPWAEELGAKGTLVVWEKMDRLFDQTEEGRQYFVRKLDDSIEHLSLVFHRFLAGEKGLRRIKLSLNGRDISAFDPFRSDHPATNPGAVEKLRLGGHVVTIQAFTLPHHQKVSPAEWEKFAGREGYVKNQGFYVYRAKRLIIYGTWFGLARQMELTKLARVRIDMPNGLDNDWKIDVKKASANPPRQVRNRLRLLIESIGASSTRVYKSKGARLLADTRLPVWQRRQNKNQISYNLNPDHPILTDFMTRLADDTREDFVKIVEMAGATFPRDAFFADMSGHPELVNDTSMSPESLELAVKSTFGPLKQSGLSVNEILEMMRAAEPFRSRWEATEKLLREIKKGESPHV